MLYCSEDDGTVRKSPKHEHEQRSCTPDFEQQQPCTSKQSHSPEKHKNDINESAAAAALPSSSAVSKLSLNSSTSSSASQQPYSSFYQELLEASYANNGKQNKSIFYDVLFSFLEYKLLL